jgi:hypothetical protein
LVPLHATAVTGLGHYLIHRQEAKRGGDHVFVSDEGQPLVYANIGPKEALAACRT